MPILDAEKARNLDFYELQIITGRDVQPNLFNDWFTGGLNYQIEHHIWPTLPRHNFHLVRPQVVALCKKHGIDFHETSLLKGVSEVLDRLYCISKSAQKSKAMKQ
jgi:fatty acid desaturase